MSANTDNVVIAVALLGVLVVVAAVTYGYYSTLPHTKQGPLVGDLQVRSTTVEMTGLTNSDLDLNIKATVYNPNSFGAKLDVASYSVYADGRYLGSGQTAHEYAFAPLSSETLTFPISVGWGSALKTTGSFILGWGHVTLKVEGTASVVVGGISISTPFEFTID